MKRNSKIVKAISGGLIGLSILFPLTGCEPIATGKSGDPLTDNIVAACNDSLEQNGDEQFIKELKLLGVDVNKSGFEFDVNFNAISSLSNEGIAYTTINYSVPASCFNDIEKTTNHKKLYNVFDKIVENFDPSDISITPISDLVKVNDAFVKNEPILFKDYQNKRAMLLNLTIPEFDDESHTINFNTKTVVEVGCDKIYTGCGLGIGFNGNAGLGVGFGTSSAEGTFIATNNYSFSVDSATYDKMKATPELVFDYCVDAINEKDASKISATRLTVTAVTYDNADMLDYIRIKDIDKELTR